MCSFCFNRLVHKHCKSCFNLQTKLYFNMSANNNTPIANRFPTFLIRYNERNAHVWIFWLSIVPQNKNDNNEVHQFILFKTFNYLILTCKRAKVIQDLLTRNKYQRIATAYEIEITGQYIVLNKHNQAHINTKAG